MRNQFLWKLIGIILFFLASLTPEINTFAQKSLVVPAANAYDLIAAVNSLRSSRGLPAYKSNSILMQIAQAQADYLASTNGAYGHIGPGGTHPIDRAIAAGYPVAGGFISENWRSGYNLNAQDVINYWMGDAPHQLTMLSADLQDIGAGVANNGDSYFYVIDCGLARGSSAQPPVSSQAPVISVSGTPVTQEATIPAVVLSTPDGKGNIYHLVQPGQTLWQIALAYKTTVNKIQGLNSLPSTNILAGQKLLISYVGTATPIPQPPTSTRNPASPTSLPTLLFFTQTPTPTATSSPTTPGVGLPGAGVSILAIIIVALAAAGLVAWVGRSRSI